MPKYLLIIVTFDFWILTILEVVKKDVNYNRRLSNNPLFGDIEKYYFMPQRVLRGDQIPHELYWMKKLKTSL